MHDLDSIIPQFYTESIDCFIIGTNGTKRVCWTYETPPNDIKSIRSLSRDFALLNKDPLESFWSRLIWSLSVVGRMKMIWNWTWTGIHSHTSMARVTTSNEVSKKVTTLSCINNFEKSTVTIKTISCIWNRNYHKNYTQHWKQWVRIYRPYS